MIILQVITCSNLGGAQTVVAILANELQAKGHEVVVAAGEGDGKIFGLLDKRIKTERLAHLKRAISPKDEFRAMAELRKLYGKYKPDVVHLHSSKAAMLGRFVFPRKKIVYTVHGFDSIRTAHRKLLPIEKFMQRRCSAIVGVSNYDIAGMRAEGITRNVCMIHNGIARPQQQDLERPKGWPRQDSFDKTVLCIARVSPPKDPLLFIGVAKALPNYAFVWIGNKEEVPYEMPENVFFLGNISNASRYCRFADLFMLPSWYEGLPMSILEAMSYGLPVVASNVGGIGEVVENGRNGFCVENKVEAFKDAILQTLEDEEKYKQMSQNAKNTYERGFTAEAMVGKYEDIYKSLK